MNNIEVELRAEVSLNQFKKLLSRLNKKSRLLSHTKRLSVMFLGTVNRVNFDIRIRINSNKKAELVIKRGKYHAHNRTEFFQKITKKQFIGIVKIFSHFGFQSKITERENFVFNLRNNVKAILVKAGSIAYVELEKMSHKENVKKNKAELLEIIDNFGLKLIKSSKQFNELCHRLTKHSDTPFDGSDSHIEKLKTMLKSY